MAKSRFDGNRWQVAGALKEALGKITGDRRREAEGAAEKNAGEVQAVGGRDEDKVRSAYN